VLIVGHHCLEMIVRFVDIGVNCWLSLFRGYQQSEQSPLNSDGQQLTPISTKRTITSKQ
jgi:hypothetical protein